MKTVTILAVLMSAGAATAQLDPATAVGSGGAREGGGTIIGDGWTDGGARTGTVIYDTLYFADNAQYDTGNGNAWSGQGIFGAVYDLQLADDFRTTSDSVLSRVTADFVTFFGASPAGGLQVDVYRHTNAGPGALVASQTVGVAAASSFTDPYFGLIGVRLTGNVNIHLDPNTPYYIMIQPVDLSSSGDWYYQVRDLHTLQGGDSYGRDGGRGNGGYGYANWTSMSTMGFGAGDTGMQIMATPGGPSCDYADCNDDGRVDTQDFICFLNQWSACR